MTAAPSRRPSGLRARTAGLEAALRKVGLPAWFLAIDLLWIVNPLTLGIDARHYQRATNAWLIGRSPWTVTDSGIPFAAGPHTLLAYLPTSVLPVPVATALWLLVGAAAALWVVRRLGLPMWWVLFPPLAHAVWNGNPQTVMLALLVAGTALAGAAAAIVKLYALLPLAFHPRRFLVAIVVLALSIAILPWQLYLESNLGVASHLQTAWNGSAWRFPVLIPFVLLALWILRRDDGDWFSVPAVFPATQFYYVSMVLPAITGRPLVAALLATPIPLAVPLVVIGLAALKVRAAFRRSGAPSVRRLVFSR